MSGGGKGGSQTVGYKYYAGVHMVICAGPIDHISRIQVADREAWAGKEDGAGTGGSGGFDFTSEVTSYDVKNDDTTLADVFILEPLPNPIVKGDTFDWIAATQGNLAALQNHLLPNTLTIKDAAYAPYIKTLTWTTGANTGEVSQVWGYTVESGSKTGVLSIGMLPNAITQGDQFTWEVESAGNGTVGGISIPRRKFQVSPVGISDLIYSITWLTGDNTGVTSIVREFDAGNNEVTLFEYTPNLIQNGDTFSWTIKFNGSAATLELPGSGGVFGSPIRFLTKVAETSPLMRDIIWTTGANSSAAGGGQGYGRIMIRKPDLFGGDKREGGIEGAIDVGMGGRGQPQNDYLVSKIGGMVPGYRGVVSLILRQLYLGNNPYLKPWKITAQRIFKRSLDGREQWYAQKAGIFSGYADIPAPVAVNFALDVSYSMNEPVGSGTRLDVLKSAMIDVLNYIQGSKIPHDIRIVLWSASVSSITRRNVTVADIADLKAFVNAAVFRGGTDANAAVSGAGGFFDGAGGKPRKFVVITDGEMSNADAAAATLFSTSDVESYGFNIALTNTTETDKLDNTGGTQVIGDGDSDAILQAFIASLKLRLLDMNPAHIIRECLTESWGRGLPENEIGMSYQTAADQLADEGLGLSIMWTQESAIDEFINEIIRHIDAVRYEDPETGLQELRLIRDDYDVETLPVLDPSNSDLVQFTEPNTFDLVNQVTVKYWNRVIGDDDTVVLQDTAAINMVGSIVNQTMDYPGITTSANAIAVGQRDLARFSRPFAKGQVRTLRKHANLTPGQLFILNDPDNGITQMVCRVAKRTENGLLNGEIVLDFGEDVFGSSYTTYGVVPPSGWIDTAGPAQDFLRVTALELPYFYLIKNLGQEAAEGLNNNASFYGMAGVRPTSGSHINYSFWTYPDGTGPESDPEKAVSGDFTPLAYLEVAVGPQDTSLIISQINDTNSIRDRQLILAGDGVDAERELLILNGSIGTTITVMRGGADTVPRSLPVGTPLYFIEALLGVSTTEYTDGDLIEGYGAPVNGSGMYTGPFTYRDLAMVGRAHRPYPAANLMVNGLYWPTQQFASDVFALTWRHRDRVLQADQTISWFEDADYGPEVGTTYRVECDAYDVTGQLIETDWFALDVGLTNNYTLDATTNQPPLGAYTIAIRVVAVRDGVRSMQSVFARVRVFTAPYNLTGHFVPD